MYYVLNDEELRSKCKLSIENMEKWARLIIDKNLTKVYGQDYFYAVDETNNNIIKRELIKKTKQMMDENPDKYSRMVDTLFLDEIIYLLCKESLYKSCFKEPLDFIYPDGRMEARTYLSSIIPIRNKLSHSNPISIREAEKVICYSNDFVDGIKKYIKYIGMQQKYNVPNIIKINDSLGNEFYLNKNINFEMITLKDKNGDIQEFDIGDSYKIWLTLDPSFDRHEYIFTWSLENSGIFKPNNLDYLAITFNEKFVSEKQTIYCTLKSNKNWHRYNGYDQQFAIVFRVLPPRII